MPEIGAFGTIMGMLSGFGGVMLGWGMHRQALKDLRISFDMHVVESKARDTAITLLTTNQAALTVLCAGLTKQGDRITAMLDRMASYPVAGAAQGTWRTGDGGTAQKNP